MPMRVGFTLFRKEMLERELAGIQELLPTLGVEKAEEHMWTDLVERNRDHCG